MTTSVSPLNTVNATKSSDEPVDEPRIEKSCLEYDYQIHDALASIKPPLDNYFNISNALYPSEDSSSKLINIWVHFINSTVNLTEVEQLKFIWSRSCLYVSDRYLSLHAMSLYSLATIWPHRRQQDLHITINEFCNPHEKRRKLLQFLSTLEDIVISPSSFNPSLNNVECIVEESSKHNFRNVEKAFPQICWLILCSSLIGSNFVSTLFLRYCKKHYQGNQSRGKAKSALLFVFVLFWLGTAVAILAAFYSIQLQILYPLIYLIFIFLVCLRRFLYCLCRGHIESDNDGKKSWKFGKNGIAEPVRGFLCTAYPGCFIAVHHTLWVMIGIITDPYWALPIITALVMMAFLFYVLSSLFFSFQTWNAWQTINFALLVAVGLSVILVQFSFFIIGQQFFDESLISSAIQSALVVILSIWLKSSDEEKSNEDKVAVDEVDGQRHSTNPTESTEEGMLDSSNQPLSA